MTVCAWVSIPFGDGFFSLQSFGVCLCLLLLGGRRGCCSILVYLLAGAAGLPVFSGFRGGLGILFGVTGGYLWGFLLFGLVYWAITAVCPLQKIPALLAGQLFCYCAGALWYYFLFLKNGSILGFGVIVLKTVVPYLLTDLGKLLFAHFLSKRLRPFV